MFFFFFWFSMGWLFEHFCCCSLFSVLYSPFGFDFVFLFVTTKKSLFGFFISFGLRKWAAAAVELICLFWGGGLLLFNMRFV